MTVTLTPEQLGQAVREAMEGMVIEMSPLPAETLAAMVASLPPGDRELFDIALQNFATARNVPNGEDDYRLTDEVKAALAQSAAEHDAGQVHTAAEVDAYVREQFGWTKKK